MILVIGAGLPRTGTLSLQAALNRLGFGPTYHMFELLKGLSRAPLWLDAVEGRPYSWEQLLEGYRSAVDWPAAFFWRELATAYPEAKVVLTVRDPATWYRSTQALLNGTGSFRVMTSRPVEFVVRPLRPVNRLMAQITLRTYGATRDDLVAGGVDEATAIAAYHEHLDAVREAIPPDRLLEFRVADGWGPLCEFLGVTVPDEPFPHRNEGGSIRRDMRRRTAATYVRGLGLPLARLAGRRSAPSANRSNDK